MAIFAYYQYIELEGGWVRKFQKPAYVIFEWFLNNQELKADQKLNQALEPSLNSKKFL